MSDDRKRIEEIQKEHDGFHLQVVDLPNQGKDTCKWCRLLSLAKEQAEELTAGRHVIEELNAKLEASQIAIGTSYPNETWIEAVSRLETALDNREAQLTAMGEHIISHTSPNHKDYACAQCDPGGENIQEGFVCMYHQALAAGKEGK